VVAGIGARYPGVSGGAVVGFYGGGEGAIGRPTGDDEEIAVGVRTSFIGAMEPKRYRYSTPRRCNSGRWAVRMAMASERRIGGW